MNIENRVAHLEITLLDGEHPESVEIERKELRNTGDLVDITFNPGSWLRFEIVVGDHVVVADYKPPKLVRTPDSEPMRPARLRSGLR